MKLYNHALAPNPRRVRIFAAEKGIKLALEEVDILAGKSRTSEFLAKNSSGARCRCSNLMTVHASPARYWQASRSPRRALLPRPRPIFDAGQARSPSDNT